MGFLINDMNLFFLGFYNAELRRKINQFHLEFQ